MTTTRTTRRRLDPQEADRLARLAAAIADISSAALNRLNDTVKEALGAILSGADVTLKTTVEAKVNTPGMTVTITLVDAQGKECNLYRSTTEMQIDPSRLN